MAKKIRSGLGIGRSMMEMMWVGKVTEVGGKRVGLGEARQVGVRLGKARQVVVRLGRD